MYRSAVVNKTMKSGTPEEQFLPRAGGRGSDQPYSQLALLIEQQGNLTSTVLCTGGVSTYQLTSVTVIKAIEIKQKLRRFTLIA